MSSGTLALDDLLQPEPTIEQEIAGLGDDDLMDFMNLSTRTTGLDGIVFVSTAMGGHGPRVKYFEKAGKTNPSFSVSISDTPLVLANSLPQPVLRRMAASVIEFVRLNKDDLLAFWQAGDSWTEEETDAFKARLKPVLSN